MTESDARSLARTGEFHIQEAIMGLLDDAADGLMFGQLVRILALPDSIPLHPTSYRMTFLY